MNFSISKVLKRNKKIREVTVRKVTTHLCLTVIVKKLKISVEQGRVITTLNILFSVVSLLASPPIYQTMLTWHVNLYNIQIKILTTAQ